MRRSLLATGCLLSLAGLTGCGSSAPHAAAPTAPATSAGSGAGTAGTTTFSGPSCPAPSGRVPVLPKRFPAGLPLPAGSRVVSVATVASSAVIARVDLPTGFRDSVRFFLAQLPRRGFTVGTGDAEAEEADIPATRGHTTVAIKVRAVPDPCRAEALLTVGGGVEPDSVH